MLRLKIIKLFTLLLLLFLGCGSQERKCERPNWDPPMIHTLSYPSWGPTDWIAFEYTPCRIIGDSIVYRWDSSGIWLIRPNGKSLTYLGPPKTPDGIWLGTSPPSWSPDGRWIITNDLSGRIWMRGVTKDTLIQITRKRHGWCPCFSPDGKKIAFWRPGPDSGGTWILDLESGRERLVFIYGDDPSWHPSGESLVICGYVEGYNSPWLSIIDTSGRYQRLIYHPEGACLNPKISPDGRKITFWDGGWDPSVWTVNVDGTEAKKLTLYGGMDPSWSPDGKKIVYVRYSRTRPCQVGNGELYVMSLDGSKEKRLTYLVHD